jgi:hypothetical protein
LRRSILRHRLLTVLVASLAFFVSRVEEALPETHHDDAGVAGVAAAAGATDGSPSAPAPASGTHHGPHIDHCAHGHNAAYGATTYASAPAVRESVPAGTAMKPSSVLLSPRLRPPIL